ncbi:amino acid adenylation domain-containing protein [Pseudomonas sp. 21LCFQ010]|uniref:amino acid adenylation domain-containing protein n=1 Tax=Pseudomonas sp. 21LCFQ010 TaxID=2957506 RepID=UPI0020972F73|nr:non-ribosomal peptide synthetase [Pseudomonas sp. 21LCFQ010]MCO8165752.1 amino acid adenylation domain-containing protein [Pseudomonas sp. 21LCFQ010]
MSGAVGMQLVSRFIRLPDDKKSQYFQAMKAEGLSFESLPIPAVRESFSDVPLSYAQERQWVLWQQEPDSTAYNLYAALRLKGALDIRILEHSFNDLICRHESLRTNFVQGEKGPRQVIHEHRTLAIKCEELDQAEQLLVQSEEGLRSVLEWRMQDPFDLQVDLLIRVNCLVVGEDDHILIVVQHHIVADRVSMQLMSFELMKLYSARVQQQKAGLPALPIQYADYSIWQRSWLEAGGKDIQLAYWKERLKDIPSLLELPLDYPRPASKSYQGERVDVVIPSELSAQIKLFAQNRQATLFMVLLASVQVLLHRYSGQRDICIGVPNSGRNRVEVQGLIGFFVNTQVMRSTFDETLDFDAVLQQVKQSARDAQLYQDLPFEQLVEALQPQRSLAHSPLFQVVYDHTSKEVIPGYSEGVDEEASAHDTYLQIEGLAWEQKTARFDLTFKTYERGDEIGAHIVYATDLFVSATIEQMATHWINVLSAVVATPSRMISELPLLTVDQAHLLQSNRNGRASLTCSVHERIERHAEQAPDSIAIVSEHRSLTYQDLNQQANQLARCLIQQGVGSDKTVGLMMPRCVEMVVGILAILKAGGAYVPIESTCTAQRLNYVIEDSGIDVLVVLTEADMVALGGLSICVLALENRLDTVDLTAGSNVQATVVPQHLAYVIYTSGSTGQPKGVAVSHGALSGYIEGLQEKRVLANLRSLAWVSTAAADLGHTVLFGALCNGITLHVIDAEMSMDGQRLGEYLHHHDVDGMKIVPSHLSALMQSDERGWIIPKRGLILGGDVSSPELVSSIFKIMPSCNVFNHYGPTETTVGVLATSLSFPVPGQKIPLGSPLSGAQVYILDTFLQPSPAAGELYVGGDCLARGYIGKPGLTAERFVPDAFGGLEGGRLYRTGDQVRRGRSGLIEYIGRIDNQVKIRGFRVEVGEVETYLQALPQVREAVVIAQQGVGGTQLVGFIVPSLEVDEATLREQIKVAFKASLPDYMAPTQWVFCQELPLTANGKWDRQALSAKALSTPVTKNDAVEEDVSALEQTVAEVWKAILKCDRVGVQDNFFELGGDSILAIRMVGALRKATQSKVNFKDVLRYQTVGELAGFLDKTVSQAPSKTSSLVKMGVGKTTEPKLFCVHPAGGNVYCYQPLSIKLQGHAQVYGISYVAGGANEAGMTWGRLVSGYVNDVVRAQPDGPYHLLGYSLGGTLAIDIAHALEAAGKKVAFLGLVDMKLPADIDVLNINPSTVENDAARGQAVDELTKVVNYFCVLYPDRATEVEQLMETAADIDYTFFIGWAANRVGISTVQFEAFFKEAIVEHEIVEGFNTLERLNLLFESFVVRPVSVRPSLWWSSVLRNDASIESVEQALKTSLFVNGFRETLSVPERHGAMIVNEAVLASITSAFTTALKEM